MKFRYLGIYFCILYLRYRAGIVTKDMMTLPKSSFWIIGFLEALGVVSGMYAAGTVTIYPGNLRLISGTGLLRQSQSGTYVFTYKLYLLQGF